MGKITSSEKVYSNLIMLTLQFLYLTHVKDFYWELNWKVTAELTTPQILVVHDLIQHNRGERT